MLRLSPVQYRTFGKLLAFQRHNRDILARQIAKALDIDTASYSRIEADDRRLSREQVRRIAALLRLDQADYTELLAASNFKLRDDEFQAALVHYPRLVERYPEPAIVIDYQGVLICWNKAFERLYESGRDRAARAHQEPYSGPAEPDRQPFLELQADTLALPLFLDSRSPIHHMLAKNDHQRICELLVEWLFITTERLDTAALAPTLGWVKQVLEYLSNLPDEDGVRFRTLWAQQLEKKVAGAAQQGALLAGGYHLTEQEIPMNLTTRVILPPTISMGGIRYEISLLPTETDARIHCLRLTRADAFQPRRPRTQREDARLARLEPDEPGEPSDPLPDHSRPQHTSRTRQVVRASQSTRVGPAPARETLVVT